MRRKIIRVGWGLIVAGVITLAVVVPVGALRANGDEEFNRWVGWATIWALLIAAIGVLPIVWDKTFPEGAAGDLTEIGELLAKFVLIEAADLRSRLIGPGEFSDQPANVRFAKTQGRFREVGGARSGDLQSIRHYHKSLSPARLVILGEPGAGKTVLALELQVRLLEDRREDSTLPIPVLISAAAYDTRQAWPQWLAAYLARRFSISKATAAALVADGRILPVVDGLDEMDVAEAGATGAASNQRLRAATLVSALNASFQGSLRAPVIVTCRLAEYQNLGRGVDRATHIEMVPLGGDESSDYLDGQFRDPGEARRWAAVLKVLRAEPAGPLAARLATPWRLMLALAVFRDGGEPADLLLAAPGTPAGADGTGVTALDRQLLGQYIAGAVGLRGKPARYRQADVQRWLTALASGLAWQARHAGSATDIELATWWKPSARRATRLAHCGPPLAFGIATLIDTLTPTPLHSWFTALYGYLGLSGTPGAPYAVVAAFLVLGLMAARTPVARRLGIRQMFTWDGARRLGVGFTCGLTVGVAFTLLFFISAYLSASGTYYLELPESAFRDLITLAILLGLPFGVAIGLPSWLADTTPRSVKPRNVITADAGFLAAVVAIAALALTLGLDLADFIETSAEGLPSEQQWGPFLLPEYLGESAIGASIGIVFGFLLGTAGASSRWSSACIRYYTTAVINWMRGRAPLRFGAFLDWARDAGLLRVSGLAYQFRHRQLQEWLAAQDRPETAIPAPPPAETALPRATAAPVSSTETERHASTLPRRGGSHQNGAGAR